MCCAQTRQQEQEQRQDREAGLGLTQALEFKHTSVKHLYHVVALKVLIHPFTKTYSILRWVLET